MIFKILSMSAFMIIFSSDRVFAHDHHSSLSNAKGNISSDSVFNLDSTWTDQDGHSFRIGALKGSPSLVAMAYTKCESSCPLIVEDMKKIGSGLAAKAKTAPSIKFVLFSFDTKRDTPSRLKAFAKDRKLNLDQWVLLQGTKKSVRDLAAVLGIRFKEDSNGEFDHSNVISLLDSEGVIRNQQLGLDQKPDEMTDRILDLFGKSPDKK